MQVAGEREMGRRVRKKGEGERETGERERETCRGETEREARGEKRA